jgi:hypothetical protein
MKGSVTFIALVRPVTPGFLIEEMRPFYAAFILFALRVVLFGFGTFPPLWLVLWALVAAGAGGG